MVLINSFSQSLKPNSHLCILNLLQIMDLKLLKKPQIIILLRGKPYNWKTWTWGHDQLKANNWSAENFKKTCDLDELAPEPTIRSCDTGQWITCFSWHLSIDHNMDVYYQVVVWCSWTGRRAYGHVTNKISWMDRLSNFLKLMGLHSCAQSRAINAVWIFSCNRF